MKLHNFELFPYIKFEKGMSQTFSPYINLQKSMYQSVNFRHMRFFENVSGTLVLYYIRPLFVMSDI